MSTTAKIISLKVRAKRSSDHAFNIGGIVESVNPSVASLGESVTAYDVRLSLYPLLGQREVDGSGKETGRLVYDAKRLRQTLAPIAACILSNEVIASELDQLIIQRQSQFLGRYQFITDMQNLVQQTYPAKVVKLQKLQSLIDQHFTDLETAYSTGIGPAGVTTPTVTMTSYLAGVGTLQNSDTHTFEGTVEKQNHIQNSNSALAVFDTTNNKWTAVTSPEPTTVSQRTVTVSQSDELRSPKLENEIRHERVSADLLDEILSESIFNLSVPNLPQIWRNELNDLDVEIYKLQVQFIDTFLFPRLNGRVTLVLKEVGENVRAGDPVIRIEDDSVIQLYGQLKCMAPISVGQQCSVSTTNVFEATPAVPLNLQGRVVSVRGYDSQRDRWNIILECQNNGTVVLPLGYDFENSPQTTTVIFP